MPFSDSARIRVTRDTASLCRLDWLATRAREFRRNKAYAPVTETKTIVVTHAFVTNSAAPIAKTITTPPARVVAETMVVWSTMSSLPVRVAIIWLELVPRWSM